MKRTRDILTQLEPRYNAIAYYIAIADVVETKVDSAPDQSIEACKALVEGLSKFMLRQLDDAYDAVAIERMPFHGLFRKALQKLSERCIFVQEEFIRPGSTLIQELGKLRDKRGDISHGKLAPKEEVSDQLFSRLVMDMTDGLVHYVLHCFSTVEIIPTLAYDDNPDFNEELDSDKDFGSILYSRALFDQEPVTYMLQLQDFLDRKANEADAAGENP